MSANGKRLYALTVERKRKNAHKRMVSENIKRAIGMVSMVFLVEAALMMLLLL